MLFQVIMTIGMLTGPFTDLMPNDPVGVLLVGVGIAIIWWRQALVYMLPVAVGHLE